ncbi:MAG: PilZ domain-containing protein [Desulfobulbaceae bacterium]|nr:PilZ domain-containing protein [Desulfobulbaceae bacterium]
MSNDKRKYERFELGLPATIAQSGVAEEEEVIHLLTRDICAGGAFFTTTHALPAGTQVKVELRLPLEKLKKIVELDQEQVRLTINGTVGRADQSGFAVFFDENYAFC